MGITYIFSWYSEVWVLSGVEAFARFVEDLELLIFLILENNERIEIRTGFENDL